MLSSQLAMLRYGNQHGTPPTGALLRSTVLRALPSSQSVGSATSARAAGRKAEDAAACKHTSAYVLGAHLVLHCEGCSDNDTSLGMSYDFLLLQQVGWRKCIADLQKLWASGAYP